MLNFITSESVADFLNTDKIDSIAIHVSVDTGRNTPIFEAVDKLYPGLGDAYDKYTSDKEMKPGYCVQLFIPGITIYILFIKVVDKFQANINDINKAIVKMMEMMRKNNKTKLLINNITSDNTKLSDFFTLPMITQELHTTDIEVWFINGNNSTIISSLDEYGYDIFQDIWKHEWFLTEDDILIVAILNDLALISNGVKLSKSRMMTVYKVCYDNGMIPNVEFTKGEYGWYFKQFMVKVNSLLNHGLLIDTERFSTSKRTDYHIGPSFPVLCLIANKLLKRNKDKIRTVAFAIQQRFYEIKKEQYENQDKDKGGDQSKSYPPKVNPF